MLIVLVLPGILFPPKKAVKRTGGQAVGDTGRAADSARTPAPPAESVAGAFLSVCPPVRPPAAVATLAETVWVSARHARFGFSPAGAQLVSAELLDYKSFAPGDSERPVQLVPAGRSMLAHCLVVGADTISLADWHFTPSVPALRVQRDSMPLTHLEAIVVREEDVRERHTGVAALGGERQRHAIALNAQRRHTRREVPVGQGDRVGPDHETVGEHRSTRGHELDRSLRVAWRKRLVVKQFRAYELRPRRAEPETGMPRGNPDGLRQRGNGGRRADRRTDGQKCASDRLGAGRGGTGGVSGTPRVPDGLTAGPFDRLLRGEQDARQHQHDEHQNERQNDASFHGTPYRQRACASVRLALYGAGSKPPGCSG